MERKTRCILFDDLNKVPIVSSFLKCNISHNNTHHGSTQLLPFHLVVLRGERDIMTLVGEVIFLGFKANNSATILKYEAKCQNR